MICPACNATVMEGSRFCQVCGSPLADADASDDRPSIETSTEAERRQITVLFCDLKGSTHLSERLDPEEYRSLIMRYQNAVSGAVRKYKGFVARYVGDGLLVYFGYPEAHENHAEHAVFAGLEAISCVAALKIETSSGVFEDLKVRIGIATGLVIVGDVKSEGKNLQQSEAFGKTPNIAARIQDIAPPNTVVVDASTHRLLADRFEFVDMGMHDLKGITESIQVWRVEKAIDINKRLDLSWESEQAPMVNREDELGIFEQYWRRATEGSSRTILISGEAGIGKSRVVRELYARIRSEPHRYYRFQCSSYHEGSAFYPVIRHIERACGLSPEDDDTEKLRKLGALIAPMAERLDTAVPLVATLMSIPVGDAFPKLDMSPERLKESTLEVLASLLVTPVSSEPALIVVEDTHWIDPSSEELMHRVMSRLRGTNILLVLTSRGAFPSHWTTQPGVISLTMDRLSQENCAALVSNIPNEGALPEDVVRQIVKRSDGVPLFAEELTKTILSSSALRGLMDTGAFEQDSDVVLPESLQDSLLARLDQLNIGKRVAQISSVIGREFSHDLLAAVSDLSSDELDRALAQLREAGVIYAVGSTPGSNYVFKHALVRDAAYESLLRARRRELHAAIATTMQSRFANLAELHPELVARHYTEAKLMPQAIQAWAKAGHQSMRRLALAEAIKHLRKGLECVQDLEDPGQQVRSELALRTLLGPALMAKQGYGSREVEEAYARARQLCDLVPEAPELFPVLFGLWGFHLVRGEYRVADKMSLQLLGLARASKDSGMMVEARGTAGVTAIYLGDLSGAREHLEEGMQVYDPRMHAGHAFKYGQDPWVACSAFHGQALWLLGYPDSGLRSCARAVGRAEELGHHFSVTFARFLHCLVLQMSGQPEPLVEVAESGLELSEKQGFPHWVPRFRLFRAWAATQLGDAEQGVSVMSACLDKSQPLSVFVRRPYYLALLAEATCRMGRVAEAQRIVGEALDELAVFEDRWAVAEIHRIRGVINLASPDAETGSARETALRSFGQSLEIAREQGAKAWEIRTLLSIHSMCADEKQWAEYRAGLADAVLGLTEGTDSEELQRALHAGT